MDTLLAAKAASGKSFDQIAAECGWTNACACCFSSFLLSVLHFAHPGVQRASCASMLHAPLGWGQAGGWVGPTCG